MAVPVFRNGALLFCNGTLAGNCCGTAVLDILVSGTGAYSVGDPPIPPDATNGCYIAVELYDENGGRVGACGQTEWHLALRATSVYTVRFYMMSRSATGAEGVGLDAFIVGAAATVNGNAAGGGSASMDMGGSPYNNEYQGCYTVANSKSFTITADPATETVVVA